MIIRVVGKKKLTSHEIVFRIYEEFCECRDALVLTPTDVKVIAEAAVDIANFAMFLVDNLGELP